MPALRGGRGLGGRSSASASTSSSRSHPRRDLSLSCSPSDRLPRDGRTQTGTGAGSASPLLGCRNRHVALPRADVRGCDRRGKGRALAFGPTRSLAASGGSHRRGWHDDRRVEPRGMRCGGAVRWNGRELELRPSSAWRERYTLVDGDDELAVSDGKGWGTQTRHDRRRVSRKHSIPAWFSASGSRS